MKVIAGLAQPVVRMSRMESQRGKVGEGVSGIVQGRASGVLSGSRWTAGGEDVIRIDEDLKMGRVLAFPMPLSIFLGGISLDPFSELLAHSADRKGERLFLATLLTDSWWEGWLSSLWFAGLGLAILLGSLWLMKTRRKGGTSNPKEEDACADGQETMQEILYHLPIPLFLLSCEEPGGHSPIRFINRCFEEIFAVCRDDLPTVDGWLDRAVPDPKSREQLIHSLLPALHRPEAAGAPTESIEFTCSGKQGVRLMGVVQGVRLGACSIVTFQDLTDHHTMSSSLEDARDALQQTAYDLTENIPVGTYTMVQPPDGGLAHFSFVSTRFLEILGLDRETVIGEPMRVFERLHPDDVERWIQLNVETFEKKTPFYGETRMIVNDEVRWVSAESIPRTLEDGSTVWEGVLIDITGRKHAEQHLIEAKQEAERLEQVKTEFLANVSHEIRTPLTVMLGINHLLQQDIEDADHRNKLAQIDRAGQTLLDIINDLLDLSKIEAGKLHLARKRFRLKELLHKVIQPYHPLLPAAVVLAEDTDGAPDVVVQGDPLRFEQILNNLLSNAVKYTEKGQIEVICTTVRQEARSVCIRVEVRDSGIGISEEDVKTLFDPFTQVDASITRHFEGTGLGLSITHRLVGLMGGEIGVSSTLGEGSVFRVELPFEVLEDESAEAGGGVAEQRGAAPVFDLRGLHVLVVDDSPSLRMLLSELLRAKGIDVEVAVDGHEALEILRESHESFDLVLMDIQMPTLDGLGTTKRIRAELGLSSLPVVALTAGLFARQQREAMETGMNDVLAKPIDFPAMEACIARWTHRQPLGKDKVGAEAAVEVRERAGREDAFPTLAGIDREHAIATTAGDVSLFQNLIDLFRREYRSVVPNVAESLERGHRDRAMQLLHKIRGSASYLGAFALAETAAALEREIRREADPIPEALQEQFAEQVRMLGVGTAPVDAEDRGD